MNYRFDDIEIDLIQFELKVNGQTMPIEPKVFNLIVYLIQQRHRVVSRDELFDEVWQGRSVSDTTLSNHIKSARKILGDNGNAQQVIKTLRTRGYQFIASVKEVPQAQTESTLSEAVQEQSNSVTDTKSVFAFNVFYLSIIGVCVAIILGLLFFPNKHKNQQPYVLVVPFSVSSEQPDKLVPFADQMTRELIQKLRKVSGLKVIPPPSSFSFKSNKARSHIQQQLPNVDYVLDGIVNQDDSGNIRINVEFEHLTDNSIVWSKSFDIPQKSSNQFKLQTDISTSVSDSLKIVLRDEEKQQLLNTPTTNEAAYQLYSRGQYQLSLMTHESVRYSITLFSQAIELDDEFEEAYIAKASAYRTLMIYFEKPIDVLPKVIASAVDVLSINPESANVMSSLGLAYVHAWQWGDAWKMLNRAKDKDPTIVSTELGLSLFHGAMGNKKGVKHALNIANRLDPLNEEIAEWGMWALMMSGQLDEAIRWGEEKIQLLPNLPYPLLSLSVAEYIQGNTKKAIKLAQQGVSLSAREPYALVILAQAYAADNDQLKAKALVLEAANKNQYMCPYETAVVHVFLGEKDLAFSYLEQAVSYQSNCLMFTRQDPRLSVLRNEKRFEQLLNKIGLNDDNVNHFLTLAKGQR